MEKLINITGKALSGEWGIDDEEGIGIPVLRTTNFTNDGIIDYSNVITRTITKKNIADKFLRKGDIIIEKSGGSDNKPVGRVVYFDNNENKYLFNNFTGLLRVKDTTKWLPKYIFYSLFANYQSGGTRRYENKTTGLHNLQTDFYVKDFEIKEILYGEQIEICELFDGITDLIDKRKRQLEKLDELVKSRFAEMFGNGNYPMVKAESVCEFITKGTTPPTGEIYAEFDDNKVPYLKVYNLSFDGSLLFDSEPQYINKEIHNGKLSRSKVYPNDVLMNIVGPPLGKFSLVTAEYPEWNINQAISIFRAKKDVLPRFLLSALMQPTVLKPFLKQAVGVRQLNISLEQCRNLQFPLPPIERQNEFVNFAEQTDKSKLEVQKSLEKLELLKKVLMQKYFG